MKKSLIVFIAVVVVFLGAALVVQSFKQMRYKEQLAVARAESDAASRDTEALQAANERLEKERERLLRQFYATEEAIAKIQSNQVALEQIRPVSIPTN